ncbi:MAG: fatty acid desaturase [Planctomycetota bacterium]|nr:fatty acid desaturase [Planctomycetota bacterium]
MESRARSWWHLFSTFAVLLAAATAAALVTWWPLRLAASIVTGLTMIRAFILVHDLHHAAIFRGSRIARTILEVYGWVLITPRKVWRETHNYHHAHTAKTDGPQRGTYTLLTTDQWRDTTRMQRFTYRVERHPLTLLCGYLTVFLIAFGIARVVKGPRRYWDSGVSLLAHGTVAALLLVFGGVAVFFFAFLLPMMIAGAAGAWLFYAQHNFEGMQVPAKPEWNHTSASLEASSYLQLGPIMRWFTGNIGFHHVHHLNPRIPFYRLPAAMRGIPELQNPITIKLNARTILSSFRLKLWDPEQQRMVSYRAARG